MVAGLGLLITLIGYFVAFPREGRRDPRIFILLALLHVVAGIAFWYYSLGRPSDTRTYFNDPYGFADFPFQAGTVFIAQVVQAIKATLGGSYLDFFILFQSIGAIGLFLLLRTIIEIARDLGKPLQPWHLALLFLPGLHFWTASIGKDPLLFLAATLSIWAMLNIERRFLGFAIAVAIMLPVRPHIAAVAAIALLGTLLFDTRTRFVFKLPIGIAAGASLGYILATTRQTLNIATMDAGALSDFIISQQEIGTRVEGGAAITGLSFPLKVLTLLFRPLFLDASGVMGFIASIENAVILIIVGTIIWNSPLLIKLAARVPFVRYCLIFASTVIILLSLVNYNIGLGLRQKYMAIPAILILFFTLVTYRRLVRGPAGPAHPAVAGPSAPNEAG